VIRALVTGCRGQVGAEVVRALSGRAEVHAFDRQALDLADARAVERRLRDVRPELIVNAGAYTAVDRAETEVGLARAVNGVAPGVIAAEARRSGALLVHFSTDYVFDGTKPEPYVESDAPNPLNVYGRTKLEGERAIAAAGCDHLVLRTSWVYGARGHNFLLTMLRLGATREELRIVDDQLGAPTSSRQLAGALLDLLLEGERERPVERAQLERLRAASGLYHATATGVVSWFAFAQAIFAEQERLPGRAFNTPRLVAIPASEYPTPARRPANSRLNCDRLARRLGVRIPPWRDGLKETISEVLSG
jgi:dTDP-4-dehydrorhamnose reductase